MLLTVSRELGEGRFSAEALRIDVGVKGGGGLSVSELTLAPSLRESKTGRPSQ